VPEDPYLRAISRSRTAASQFPTLETVDFPPSRRGGHDEPAPRRATRRPRSAVPDGAHKLEGGRARSWRSPRSMRRAVASNALRGKHEVFAIHQGVSAVVLGGRQHRDWTRLADYSPRCPCRILRNPNCGSGGATGERHGKRGAPPATGRHVQAVCPNMVVRSGRASAMADAASTFAGAITGARANSPGAAPSCPQGTSSGQAIFGAQESSTDRQIRCQPATGSPFSARNRPVRREGLAATAHSAPTAIIRERPDF